MMMTWNGRYFLNHHLLHHPLMLMHHHQRATIQIHVSIDRHDENTAPNAITTHHYAHITAQPVTSVLLHLITIVISSVRVLVRGITGDFGASYF
jgi:hypothetical protein